MLIILFSHSLRAAGKIVYNDYELKFTATINKFTIIMFFSARWKFSFIEYPKIKNRNNTKP